MFLFKGSFTLVQYTPKGIVHTFVFGKCFKPKRFVFKDTVDLPSPVYSLRIEPRTLAWLALERVNQPLGQSSLDILSIKNKLHNFFNIMFII